MHDAPAIFPFRRIVYDKILARLSLLTVHYTQTVLAVWSLGWRIAFLTGYRPKSPGKDDSVFWKAPLEGVLGMEPSLLGRTQSDVVWEQAFCTFFNGVAFSTKV